MGAQPPQALGEGLGADIGKAESIHERLLVRVAKDAGTGIAGLGMKGNGAELGKAKTEIFPGERGVGVLVDPGGDSKSIPEREPQ